MANKAALAVVSLVLLTALHPTCLLADQSPADVAFFEKKIRPVLIKHCYECHSAAAAKTGDLASGLQLDTRAGIRRGGDSGPAVVPEKPEQSLLLAALRHERDLQMPPDGRLPATVVADFAAWIKSGAADPRDGRPVDPAFDLTKARDFWSFQPVKQSAAPPVRDTSWPRSDLDRFVLARREARQLEPVGDAPRPVLIRRLFFDLIGLPPTREELRRFQQTSVAEAVDYLLASPHFGERWGRHWLDVARYAESNGRARNMAWQHAWRYRDWVINALNRDLPYDEFIRQQIAGDLLPAANDTQRDRQIIATGFLALGPKSLEERNRELFRMDTIDEQIDVVSRGILGLSASCSRCHDHKFDPIPTADYYRLAGILSSTDALYGIGPMGIKGVNDSALAPIGSGAKQLIGPAAKHLEAVKVQTQKRNTARSDRYRVVRRVADAKRKLAKPAADKDPLEKEIADMEAEIKDWDERIKKLDEELAALVASPPPQPQFAMGARDSDKPADCRIRVRGEPTNYGERVPRGVLRAVEVPGLPAIGESQSGRLQLAEWLTSSQNPLTQRVIVNRVWLHLFGRGLVDTPNDFGATGSKPSHPLLLDYLAARFVDNGWSVKELIREIVLSRTYQLSSDTNARGVRLDPDNTLLWRMPVRRLEVEPFRDALLVVSGRLNRERRAGSPIQAIGVFSDYEFNSKTKLTPEMIRTNHRSVYLPVVRGALPELFQLFDFADPNSLVGRRDETTIPSQALYLMNSPAMIEFASATASRLLAEDGLSDAQRVQWLFEAALGRRPATGETDTVLSYIASRESRLGDAAASEEDSRLQAWSSACQMVLASSEFRHLK